MPKMNFDKVNLRKPSMNNNQTQGARTLEEAPVLRLLDFAGVAFR